jgi:hypothetical protein
LASSARKKTTPPNGPGFEGLGGKESNPAEDRPSYLEIHDELAVALPVPDGKAGIHHNMPALRTSADYDA